jgi:hypothetical protein
VTKPAEHDPLAWIKQGREERPAKKAAAKPKAAAKAKPKVKTTRKK